MLPILALLFLQTLFASGERMPRFVFTPTKSPKMLLVWNDIWEAGTPNSLVLLSSGYMITIRVRVDGVPTGAGLKRILTCSCPTKSSQDEIDLDSLTGLAGPPFCSSDIPFTLKRSTISSDEFYLTMSDSSVTYANVFGSKVTLTVKAQYSSGVLQSNSLTMWNLDPISAFPASSASPAGYDRNFLTDTAITFLTQTNLGSTDFYDFQFLEPSLITTIQSAPTFFKQKLNLGAILNFDPTPCSYVQFDRSMLFTTYDSKLSLSQMEQMKTAVLDRKTGTLSYARCQLYRAIRVFYDGRGKPSQIGICRSVAFSGYVVPYSRINDVKTRISSSEFNYLGCSDTAKKTCKLVGVAQQNVTIYSGMDSTQLVCPIICDDSTMVFRFYFNDQQLLPPVSTDWSDWSDRGVRISRSSNVVEISNDASVISSGVYKCDAGAASATFYVSVVSMPSFSGQVGGQDAVVPPMVFAMQGESLSFSCGIRQSGLVSPVVLQPQFYLPSTSAGVVRWTQSDLATFNGFVSPASSAAVSVSTSAAGPGAQLLNVSIPSVPPPQASFGYNLTHRFVCSATVSGADALNLGMTGYAAQSGGDVLFVPRPTRENFVLDPNNDCAAQKCYLGNGATFRFGLSDQYAAYLSNVGVEVVSFLRIDNLLLTDIKVLMNNNVSVIFANTTSLVYQVNPISRSDVRSELQKRSSLTPVFNLRYRSSSDMGNVNLLKSRHGPPTVALGPMDCRVDSLCFYSTDFDVPGSLDFLAAPLDFNNPTPALAGANLTIMIAVIVVCVVLIIVLVVLVWYFANRPPAKTYHLEAKEIEQGHNPTAEAKDEQFKEYNRQTDTSAPDRNGTDIPMTSGVYGNEGFYESLPNSRALGPEDVRIDRSDEV